jgi:hypothetical protein
MQVSGLLHKGKGKGDEIIKVPSCTKVFSQVAYFDFNTSRELVFSVR